MENRIKSCTFELEMTVKEAARIHKALDSFLIGEEERKKLSDDFIKGTSEYALICLLSEYFGFSDKGFIGIYMADRDKYPKSVVPAWDKSDVD